MSHTKAVFVKELMSEELLCTMSDPYLVHSCSIVAFKVLIRFWGLTFIGGVIAYNYTETLFTESSLMACNSFPCPNACR